MDEIIALIEQRLALLLRERIGKAISHIQPRPMSTLAIFSPGSVRQLHLTFIDRDDLNSDPLDKRLQGLDLRSSVRFGVYCCFIPVNWR